MPPHTNFCQKSKILICGCKFSLVKQQLYLWLQMVTKNMMTWNESLLWMRRGEKILFGVHFLWLFSVHLSSILFLLHFIFLFSKYFSFTNYNGADFCPKVLFLLFYVIYVAPVNYLLCGQSRPFVNPTRHLPPPAPPMNNSFPTHL